MPRLLIGMGAGLLVATLLTGGLERRAGEGAALAQGPWGRLAPDAAPAAGVDAAGANSDAPPAALSPEERQNIFVYRTARPGVVNITTSTVQFDPLMGLPIGGQGAGSGSVLDKQGHILTNNHVIDDARTIEVTLASGDSYPARLVGADAVFDMAVIKIDAPPEELVPIRLGQSSNLQVGQKAYAVGNPFGLEGTLTVGIVSSLGRSVPSRVGGRAMTGIIQTDAAMNPGNSGGPLLNSRAEMIGMNVAIASKIGQNSGVGFAIPVDRVRRYVPELIENGKVLRAYHGIVKIDETPRGLRLRKLSRGGPAERAGLRGVRVVETKRRRGPILYVERQLDLAYADTLIAIAGRPVATYEDFLREMDRYRPGDVVDFIILRDGQRRTVPVTMGAA